MRYFLLWLLSTALLAQPATAQTQLDPNFLAQEVYQPTYSLSQALQLSDGSRILVGNIWRADGVEAYNNLVKYLPSGQLDAAFNARMAQYNFYSIAVAEAPGNKLVVGLSGPGTFGSQTHYGVVRLGFDGTLDTGFVPQPSTSASYFGSMYLVQADGKIVVANELAQGISQSIRVLARLNADGTPDTNFNSQLSTVFSDPAPQRNAEIRSICQQPDGKLLVTGSVVAGTIGLQSKIIRLQTTGATDASFATGVASPQAASLQPDGKILVITPTYSNQGLLIRLLPTGAVDASFQAPTNLTVDYVGASIIQVQANGRILVANAREQTANQRGASSFMVRLLANGTLDNSWQPPMYGDYQARATNIQMLPSGQVLVAGNAKLYASATALPSALGVLDATTGANVPGFAPLLQQGGEIYSMALQTDGRIVVGGAFSEINGTPARNMARFNGNGTLDAAFTTSSAVTGGTVSAVLLQPDGKIVLSGDFGAAGGRAQSAVARLLTSGLSDPAFTPALQPHSAFNLQLAYNLARQPDGQFIVSGNLLPTGATQPRALVRLTTTGQLDASFLPTATPSYNFWYPVLVQPNGRIVTANLDYQSGTGSLYYESVARLLPDGSVDPSFARIQTRLSGRDSPVSIQTLDQYPDGRLLVAGNFNSYGSTTAGHILRLLATGVIDATFLSPIGSFRPNTTALQPNGRLLAAGVNFDGTTNPPIIRLLDDGSVDASFVRTQGPAVGSSLHKLLVQPNGGILVAGFFVTAAGQPRMGLVRLLDANVLHVTSAQTETLTTAWPVPTHGDLHLALDAAARPQQVQLFDALGRMVLTQAVSQPEMTLPTTALPPGTYLLRVSYATGAVTRRVVVE